ncbi:hypothetical protein EMPS_00759 [Entomortierella parvispora]|uniref:Arrestin C-terminal-like domain-containing protein n=1 Tax=Entomortierella parvispora TaxID=205924 RepID=A0A9P3H2A6_9FUNG|nr:hypothetical protein EMPS_00759 [Entomortierella parvispora]
MSEVNAQERVPTGPVGSPPSYATHDQTPPESPRSSPDRATPVRTSSSTSSLDHLPPAMSAQRSTPAPSQEHSDMVAHTSDLVLEDDEDEGDDADHDREEDDEDIRRASALAGRRRSYGHHHHPSSGSRPQQRQQLTLPAATAASLLSHNTNQPALTHAVAGSAASYSYSPTIPSRSDTGVSSVSSSRSNSRRNSLTQQQQQQSQNSISPFSFFTHKDEHPSSSGSGTKTLKIELAHPEVVLKSGEMTTMKGIVYVNCHKPVKVKTLLLEFSGRSSVTWVDDNAYSPATRHTTAPHIEHSWTLVGHQHKQPPTILAPGQHAFTFSLDMPETLPETLTTTHGKVAYRLTATLNKPGLTFHSSSVTIPVTILRRQSVQASRAYQRGGRAASKPEDQVSYKISMPQTRVPHSTKIPLQVSITAPSTRTNINVLQVSLWERVVYRADGRKRVDLRLVKIQKSEGWARPPHQESDAVTWNKVLLFDMPPIGSEQNQCNPSADNGLMKVTHMLRFSILGAEGTKRFRLENDIDLKVLAFEDEYQMDDEDDFEDEEDEFEEQQEGHVEIVDGHPVRVVRRRRRRGEDRDGLPSYLTSFSTPRVSFDSERDMDPADDDLLRAMVARIHLPTYAESESDINSRNPSRDVSRNASRAASRSTSPERGISGSSGFVPNATIITASGGGFFQQHPQHTPSPIHQHHHHHHPHHGVHSPQHHHLHHQPHGHSPLAGSPPRVLSPADGGPPTERRSSDPQGQQRREGEQELHQQHENAALQHPQPRISSTVTPLPESEKGY